MVTTTEERTYAVNIHLEKQLSAQLAPNQAKRCQEEGNCLESEDVVGTCKRGDALGVGIAAGGVPE